MEGRAARRRLPHLVVRGARRPTRAPRPSSPSAPVCARTSSRPTRRSIPSGFRWCTTGSTRSCGSDAPDEDVVRRHGVDPDKPSVVFVGRITRQKGLPYLLRAAASLPPDVQLVLCAGAPDTTEILAEVEGLDDRAQGRARRASSGSPRCCRATRSSRCCRAATVFACPSVYEPLGIVNLEAMACELAVVATATGGIPEVVVDGETGWLVPIEQVARRHRHPGRPRRLRRRPRRRAHRRRLRRGPGPRTSAWPVGRGRWSTSRGPRSATGPWRSTEQVLGR